MAPELEGCLQTLPSLGQDPGISASKIINCKNPLRDTINGCSEPPFAELPYNPELRRIWLLRDLQGVEKAPRALSRRKQGRSA
jgi:hypothetical protein